MHLIKCNCNQPFLTATYGFKFKMKDETLGRVGLIW